MGEGQCQHVREKTEVGELGWDDLFKLLHREDWANVWRHLVDILIPFVEPLNMFTETDDLWVKVIHTEMEFDYKVPTITWRSFALLCNSHHVTFTFKQISYFLGPRFWNYQISPCVQPYTWEHKGPDEHRNKESLDFHTNCSTSISLLFLPRLQIPRSLWMATSASWWAQDAHDKGEHRYCV